MKNFFKSYTSFTRAEKNGLVVLFAIMVILLGIRMGMQFWVKPHTDEEKQKQLSAAWADFKKHNAINDTTSEDIPEKEATATPAFIDLNTADSATLVRLNGIGPVTAHKIMERRKEKGPFKDFNELLEIRHFPKEVFEALKGQLKIQPQVKLIN